MLAAGAPDRVAHRYRPRQLRQCGLPRLQHEGLPGSGNMYFSNRGRVAGEALDHDLEARAIRHDQNGGDQCGERNEHRGEIPAARRGGWARCGAQARSAPQLACVDAPVLPARAAAVLGQVQGNAWKARHAGLDQARQQHPRDHERQQRKQRSHPQIQRDHPQHLYIRPSMLIHILPGPRGGCRIRQPTSTGRLVRMVLCCHG